MGTEDCRAKARERREKARTELRSIQQTNSIGRPSPAGGRGWLDRLLRRARPSNHTAAKACGKKSLRLRLSENFQCGHSCLKIDHKFH
jgi:hypothetical protein